MSDADIQGSYVTIRPHGLVDRQKMIGPGIILDLDDEDNVVGIETIGTATFSEVLFRALTVAKFPKAQP
jgi:uncharacterized protein YuzE